MYYLGLIIFVYFFSIICGLISSLIILLTEKIIFPRETLVKLQLQRGIKAELRTSSITNFHLSIKSVNLILLVEDFITGVLRGGLVAFTSFKILGFLISVQNEKVLGAILIGHTIIIIRHWSKEQPISDEVIKWSGDFLGIVLVFLLLTL